MTATPTLPEPEDTTLTDEERQVDLPVSGDLFEPTDAGLEGEDYDGPLPDYLDDDAVAADLDEAAVLGQSEEHTP